MFKWADGQTASPPIIETIHHIDRLTSPTLTWLHWSWTVTNDGHGTIKSEPAPRKRENWIENHEPILNPNQLFDLAISNCKTIRAIYINILRSTCGRAGVTT
jgi:hypothetical protein